MIRVNLLPQKKRALGRSGAQPSQKWLIALLIGVLLEMAGLFFFHQRKLDELARQEQKNKELTAKITDIKKLVANTTRRSKKELHRAAAPRGRDREAPAGPPGADGGAARGRAAAHARQGAHGRSRSPRAAPPRQPEPRVQPGLGRAARLDHELRRAGSHGEDRGRGARRQRRVRKFAQRLKLSTYFYDVQLLPGKKGEAKDAKLEIINFALQLKVRY